jgi:polysaccharide biosynthesis/export protein
MKLKRVMLRRVASAGLAGLMLAAAVLVGNVLPAAPQPAPQDPQAAPSQPQPVTDTSQPSTPPSLPASTGPVSTEYTLGSGDVVDISVLGEPQVSGSAIVSPDGSITLQLVGKIQAQGLTLPQLTAKITDSLKKYIRNPQVSIAIRSTSAGHQLVYLLGRVGRPGAYEIQTGWTVASLIAVAGGPAPGAALPKAFILRKDTRISVDLQHLIIDGDATANISLEPGDVMIVPEDQEKVLLMGQVARPGAYVFKPGDRIVDLLSAAGGPTQNAVVSSIGIIRQTGPKPSVTPINLDKFYKSADAAQNVALQSGDIVYVPEKPVMNWQTILGTIVPFVWLLK